MIYIRSKSINPFVPDKAIPQTVSLNAIHEAAGITDSPGTIPENARDEVNGECSVKTVPADRRTHSSAS